MLTHRLRSTFLVAIAAAAWTLAPRVAQAGLMYSYDVDSLAFDADEIVLVTQVNVWEDKPNHRTFETLRVKTSYAGGSLHEGDSLDLETSCYNLAPIWGWHGQPDVSDDRIVFMKKAPKDVRRSPALSKPLEWSLLDSGMRIFVDERVHAFAQENNPGCYGPTPGEGPKGAPYSRAAFERVLLAAIAHAKDAHTLLVAPPSQERTEKLLAVAQPAPDRDFGRDRIGSEVMRAFGNEQNVDALLEAHSRLSRVDHFFLHHRVSAGLLLDAALSSQQPLHRRRAALALLEGVSFELAKEPKLGLPFATLLSDPDASIRLGALAIHFPDKKTPPELLAAILQRYPREPDGNVRYALFQRARTEGLLERLVTKSSDMPLAMWKIEHRTLSIEWTTVLGMDAGWPEEIALELRSSVGAVVSRELVPRERYSVSSSLDSTSAHVPLVFPSSVPPGTYDVRASVTIKNERRRFGGTSTSGPSSWAGSRNRCRRRSALFSSPRAYARWPWKMARRSSWA